MNVIVVGCGRVGSELAYRLFEKGHKVSVIDIDESAFANLPHDFRGRTIEGDALHVDVLHRAGIETAEAVAAVTNADTLNCVVAHTARQVFNIPNIVTRNYDTAFRDLYDVFGLQVISSSSWGAQRIEEMLYSDLHTVFSAGNGEVEIYEFAVPKAWAGKALGDLLAHEQAVAVSLTRAGRAIIPTRDAALQENDSVLVSATLEGIEAVRMRLRDLLVEKEE